jgi:sugar lactone lactonase YvrE
MKKTLLISLLGLSASLATARADGYIYFENYNFSGPSDGLRYATTNVPAGTAGQYLDPGFTVSLYWSLGTVSEPTTNDPVAVPVALTLLGDQGGPSLTNYPTIVPDPNYFVGFFGLDQSANPNVIVTLPGYVSGPVTFEVVAWANSGPYGGTNYASSGLRGHSKPFTMTSISTSLATIQTNLPQGLAVANPPNGSFTVSFVSPVNAPQIIQQPANQAVNIGQSAAFNVTANGTQPLSYQWSFNGANIPNATNATLTLNSVQPSQAGNYAAVVSNPAGSVLSSNALLMVNTPPTITTQPGSQTVNAGQNASFSVVASGSSPLSYQWSFNGNAIANATNATLALNNVQLNQAGNYGVLVSNGAGSTNSANAVLIVNPVVCVNAPSGMIGWWRGEGDATDAVGINNGTLYSAVGFVPGEVGSAFSFNGSSYVSIPDSPSLDALTSAITVEAWFKVNQFSGQDWTAIVSKGEGTWQIRRYVTSSQLTFTTIGLSNTELVGTRNINDGQWHHVAAVYDGAMKYLYVDGTLDVSAPATGLISQTSRPLCIGDSPDHTERWLNGLVDEVSIYNRVLTSTEIQSIYNAGSAGKCVNSIQLVIATQPASQTVNAGQSATFGVAAAGGSSPLSYQWDKDGMPLLGATNATLNLANVQPVNIGNYTVVVTDNNGNSLTSSAASLSISNVNSGIWQGLVAYYPFNGNANDATGNGNNGTVNGATLTIDRFGNPSSAYAFAGSPSSDITIQSTNILVQRPFTCSLWVYFNGGTGNPRLFSSPAWEIAVSSTGFGFSDITDAGGYTCSSARFPTQGSWHHIVVVSTTNQLLDYADGNLSATLSVPGNLVYGSGFGSIWWPTIGSSRQIGYGGDCLVGSVDDVRIYNRALSSNDVAQLYASEAPQPPAITSQPASQTVIAGQSATFNVTATSTAPLSYQWSFNGNAIANATNATLTLTNVQWNQAGNYAVLVSNPYGSTNSGLAALTVNVSPAIVQQPINQTNLAGTTATFSVSATGTQPMNYQWQFNGANLPNTTFTPGIITTVAGHGTAGYSGDGGPATNAAMNAPNSVVSDASGNLFIVDCNNQRIRKVSANGVITTVAGNGSAGYSGDGGPATNASMNTPNGIAIDASGNLFISDGYNNRIRKVDQNGIITTVAGNGTAGYSGDGGLAINARLYNTVGLAVDASGNLFIADCYNYRIRKVSTNGIITTVAGNGVQSYSGDGGAAINASLNNPYDVVVDDAGNLFIADLSNNRVRKVNTNGIISTVAGNGSSSYSGDGGAATSAGFNSPTGVALDASGNLFIADYWAYRVRKVNTSGIISTVAGNGTAGYSGDGGVATNANLGKPWKAWVDSAGNMFIAEYGNNTIRKVTGSSSPTLTIANVSAANAGNYSVIISNPYGAVTSVVATLTVDMLPPTISAQSGSQTNFVGSTANFSVTAGGTAPLSYQWSFNGNAIVNATNATLTLNNVQLNQAGNYAVLVSNPYGSTNSPIVVLTVIPPPVGTAVAWPMYQGNPAHTGYVPVSLKPSTFALRWVQTIQSGVALNPVTAADGKVFVSQYSYFGNAGLYVLDAATGNILWNTNFGSVFSVNPPSYGNGNVYIQTCDNYGDTYLHAFQAATGAFVFRSPHGAQWERYFAPTIFDGNVYVDGGEYGGMYSFDSINGLQNWFGYVGQYDGWTPAVDSNYCYVCTGSGDTTPITGEFRMIDRATGKTTYLVTDNNFQWNGYTMDEAVTLGPNNDAFAINIGRLLMFDLRADATHTPHIGRVLSDHFTGQTTLANGVLYVNNGGILVALDELTGSQLWAWTPPSGSVSDTIIATENLLFVGTGSATYAIDLVSHQAVWSYPVSGHLAWGEDVLYVAGANGTVTAFTASSSPPSINSQPTSITNLAGTTATFMVTATGTTPLAYQWLKGGSPLIDGGNVSGSTTATLTLNNALGGDAGVYSVIVSNPIGSTVSSPATLTVIDPVIVAQPVGQAESQGGAVDFSVAATGTSPLAYQWTLKGVAIARATNATLTLTNLHLNQAGNYQVTVSNSYGTAVSSNANLTVTAQKIVVYTYSGSEKVTTAGQEYTYVYTGQLYLNPDNTNGVFIGWGMINGHRQYWVSPFSNYLLTTVQGSGGRVYTLLGKAGDGFDEKGRPSIWSYFHEGLNAELNIGWSKPAAFPITFECEIKRVYPDTATGAMILRKAQSTYTFAPPATQKANIAGKTIWDLVNEQADVLILSGYQKQ